MPGSTTILIFDGRDPLRNRCVTVTGNYRAKLAMAHRGAKAKFTIDSLAKALDGKPADPARAKVTIKLTGWAAYLTVPGQSDEVFRVGPDPKPTINHIRDFRTRPAPFLRDGSCRG